MAAPATLPTDELLDTLLKETLTWLDSRTHHTLQILARHGGYVRGATRFAREAGYRDRHQLHRALTRHRLPSLEVLAGWIRVLRWSLRAERHPGLSLATLALEDSRDPAGCSRHICQVTGCTWTELKMNGPRWLAEELRARCLSGAADAQGATDRLDPRSAHSQLLQSAPSSSAKPSAIY